MTAPAPGSSPVPPRPFRFGVQASRARDRAEWVDLARRHDFMLFADECYGELYRETPPPGALEAAGGGAGACANVVSFNSLSKRSGMPGLRVGFAAGGSWAIHLTPLQVGAVVGRPHAGLE